MLPVSERDMQRRMAFDNPWWEPDGGIDADIAAMPRRVYFDALFGLIADRSVNRAVVLMGPRRVGKTVMLYQCIDRLLHDGVPRRSVFYMPLDAPVYSGIGLQRLLDLAFDMDRNQQGYVFFDEIQYLKGWELHLKSLVDSFRNMRFVVSGSAAAALRLKSTESGAGRFTDFILPPLTFFEYLGLMGEYPTPSGGTARLLSDEGIRKLNHEFLNYLNFGGFPEAARSESIQHNLGRYVRGDIIDKVLLRDLPSLYGIDDAQSLNAFFARLAYNTGNEVSIDSISQDSGLAKNTVRKFLDYLEAAFLIVRVTRIDENARHFKKNMTFKVYLTNPSLRAALFEPVDGESDAIGPLVETAIFSQWFHSPQAHNLHYARWDRSGGEVDMVYLHPGSQAPAWAAEIKWSDRFYESPQELRGLVRFARGTGLGRSPNPTGSLLVTTRTVRGTRQVDGLTLQFVPSAVYCFNAGLYSQSFGRRARGSLPDDRALPLGLGPL